MTDWLDIGVHTPELKYDSNRCYWYSDQVYVRQSNGVVTKRTFMSADGKNASLGSMTGGQPLHWKPIRSEPSTNP